MNEGAIGAVVVVLRKQGASDGLLVRACRALSEICSSVEENRMKAVCAGFAKGLTALQQRAAASQHLQAAAHDALSRLSESNGS